VRQPSLPTGQAIALGLLHGPAELLPISSSGHTLLIPWLRGWSYDQLDPAARKRFEVALHAGALLGLAVVTGGEIAIAGFGARRLAMLALATAPAALAGLALERPIERRFSTPANVALGLVGGAASMALADRIGARDRTRSDATARDGLAFGLAQAVALLPGVSRSGAVRTVARARGFAPAAAAELAVEVGLPVTIGALLLKGREVRHAGKAERQALAAGALASFAATVASRSLVRRTALGPYAAYRAVLGTAVLRRLRHNARR
jgi:undecaprenyl-diphosphatase